MPLLPPPQPSSVNTSTAMPARMGHIEGSPNRKPYFLTMLLAPMLDSTFATWQKPGLNSERKALGETQTGLRENHVANSDVRVRLYRPDSRFLSSRCAR